MNGAKLKFLPDPDPEVSPWTRIASAVVGGAVVSQMVCSHFGLNVWGMMGAWLWQLLLAPLW